MSTLLDNLYTVFARYPLKQKIVGCPHCELKTAEQGLHTRLLDSLGWDELGVYSFKAMTTFGDMADFKHFLPRLIELNIQAPFETPYGAYILFDKLAYAKWLDWPENERSAVTAIIQDWAEKLRASGTGDDSYVLKEVTEGMRGCGMVPPDCCGAETVPPRDAAIG